MAKSLALLVFVPAALFCLTLGCSASDPGTVSVGGSAGAVTSAAGSSGSANTAAGSGGAAAGSGGAPSSAGSPGAAGAGAMSGAAGSGTAGSTGAAGASGGGGGGGGLMGHVRTGMSAGCGKVPPNKDNSKSYTLHEITVTGLGPTWVKGGTDYKNDGKYDFAFRPYGLRLPSNYDPTKPYAVTFGGGGCGGSATNFAGNPNGGSQVAPDGTTIQVGLAYIGGCFDDEGVDTPDEPYFRAVMKELEANYCFDLSKVFVSGSSSGAWESYMLGCAAADLVRGIATDEGGERIARPMCKNPVAAVLVAGEADTENPIGPLDPTVDAGKRLGSYGSGPSRDEILKRNGCNGTATEKLMGTDAQYTACVKYTGCPAAYPVVWCSLPGVGHNSSKYMNVDYFSGPSWDILSALPAPQ